MYTYLLVYVAHSNAESLSVGLGRVIESHTRTVKFDVFVLLWQLY